MELSKKQKVYLLAMIKEEIDIGNAYDAGFMLTEILSLLIKLQEEGFCQRHEEQYILTDRGEAFLNEYGYLIKTNFKIVPLYDAKTPKLTLAEVFLPEKAPTNLQ